MGSAPGRAPDGCRRRSPGSTPSPRGATPPPSTPRPPPGGTPPPPPLTGGGAPPPRRHVEVVPLMAAVGKRLAHVIVHAAAPGDRAGAAVPERVAGGQDGD